MPQNSAKKPPSQRQLRVGEEIRHAVSTIMMRNEIHEPLLEKLSITVSEVRISPDLKNASVYVTPLAGSDNAPQVIERLNQIAPGIRKSMSKHVFLKYTPKIFFKMDKSFDAAGRINELLQDKRVREDVEKPEGDTDHATV